MAVPAARTVPVSPRQEATVLTERRAADPEIVDANVLERAAACLRDAGIALPTFAQLADPSRIPAKIGPLLAGVGPDDAHPLNLFRVHWFNGADRTTVAAVPDHVVLPRELTGVDAKIVVALGDRFPMIRAHKVLAAYGCLAPRLVTGQFDPTRNRAVWPSTGNYCRGGVAISRLMGCRGVAVLPEGMSRERFAWLEDWVVGPERHHPDARHGEQRQGDLRQVPRARGRPRERHLQPVRRVREPHRALPRHRRRARARLRDAAGRASRRSACARSCRRPAPPGRSPPATT